MAVLVVGLVQARTVNLTHLAGAFRGPAKLSSNYRRLQRFFQYVRFDADWLARTLVASYRDGPAYCYMNAFKAAACATAGQELAGMLETDLQRAALQRRSPR